MTQSETFVDSVKNGAVLKVSINRPEALNALNSQVLEELRTIFTNLQSDSEVRVVQVSGAGPKSFVAGADIGSMAEADQAGIETYIQLGLDTFALIAATEVPVIAAVNGFALGGGMELALACDFIVAVESAKVGLPEVSLGVIPGFGGTQRLIQRVGLGRAKQVVLTGDMFSAKEAYELGLVDKLCKAEELEQTVDALCQSIVTRGPLAVKAAKRVMNAHADDQLNRGLSLEKEAFIELFKSADRKEGMSAFLEKRPAVFSAS